MYCFCDGKAVDLHTEGTWFKSRPGYYPYLLWLSPMYPNDCKQWPIEFTFKLVISVSYAT